VAASSFLTLAHECAVLVVVEHFVCVLVVLDKVERTAPNSRLEALLLVAIGNVVRLWTLHLRS